MADRGAARRRRFTVDSLFTDSRPQAVGVADLVEAKQINLDRIRSDPSQPRQTFDEEKLEELAASIRLEGVLQPIVVRYEPGRDIYIVVQGERRWRASRMAGLASIPAMVRDVPIERRLIQQLMENIVRDDLNALDRASALRALKVQLRDAPWEAVAEAVGIRRSRLFQLLGTEKLPETARDDIRAGRLSEKQSRALQGLPAAAQEALREAIITENIPAEEAARLARSLRDETLLEDAGDIGERVRQLRTKPAPGPAAARPTAQVDGSTATASHERATGGPTPSDDVAADVSPGRPASRSAPTTLSLPDPWRLELDGLLDGQSAATNFDAERVRNVVRQLASELRNAEADDLRDGSLTADLIALRGAIDGALDSR